MLGRAADGGLVDLRVHDLRAGARDRHRSVDDAPFGGGAGMVLMPEPGVRRRRGGRGPAPALLLLGPAGRRFDQSVAAELAAGGGFSLLCGRYEGVDQRVADHLVDGELSIGDFVLAGGELAALVVVEAVARLVPGVLGQRGVDRRGELHRRAAGVSPVHQAGPVPGLGGARGPALGGPRPGWPGGAGPRPCRRTLERRPDLVAARGGLRDEEVELLRAEGEVRLLAEHGYIDASGQSPVA